MSKFCHLIARHLNWKLRKVKTWLWLNFQPSGMKHLVYLQYLSTPRMGRCLYLLRFIQTEKVSPTWWYLSTRLHGVTQKIHYYYYHHHNHHRILQINSPYLPQREDSVCWRNRSQLFVITLYVCIDIYCAYV